jgi:hypothetical protein
VTYTSLGGDFIAGSFSDIVGNVSEIVTVVKDCALAFTDWPLILVPTVGLTLLGIGLARRFMKFKR